MPAKPVVRKPEIAELICERIATGHTLKQIARELGCDPTAITHWRRDDPAFGLMYEQAREDQADYFAEEILEIADDGSNDWVDRQSGDRTARAFDHEHVQRSRLRIDTRKWAMSKMLPKKYGDRLALTGVEESDIDQMTDEQRARWAYAVMERARRLLQAPTIEHDSEDDDEEGAKK